MRNNMIVGIILLLIVIFAILLSGRFIFYHDFMFLYDQVREIALVKDMIITHKLALIGTHSGIGGFFHGPFGLYILIPFYFIGKGNPLWFSIFYKRCKYT